MLKSILFRMGRQTDGRTNASTHKTCKSDTNPARTSHTCNTPVAEVFWESCLRRRPNPIESWEYPCLAHFYRLLLFLLHHYFHRFLLLWARVWVRFLRCFCPWSVLGSAGGRTDDANNGDDETPDWNRLPVRRHHCHHHCHHHHQHHHCCVLWKARGSVDGLTDDDDGDEVADVRCGKADEDDGPRIREDDARRRRKDRPADLDDPETAIARANLCKGHVIIW